MERPQYHILRQLVELIDRPARNGCVAVLDEVEGLMVATPGSTHNHQTWPGGYYDHICEVMNLACVLFPALKATGRDLGFTLSDALLVLFFHDLEKLWKYVYDATGKIAIAPELEDKESQHEFRLAKLKEFDMYFTEAQLNAMKYVEGEDKRTRDAKMGPLASFCHCCDTLSARGFPEHPLEAGDPWSATRPSRR
jgi:hypothetical protein